MLTVRVSFKLFSYPEQLFEHYHSTNPRERLNKEVRRRPDVIRSSSGPGQFMLSQIAR